jgi:hypothetical protein
MKYKKEFKGFMSKLLDNEMFVPYSHVWMLTYVYKNPKINTIKLSELMVKNKHILCKQTAQNYVSSLKRFGILEYTSMNSPIKINSKYLFEK